MLKIRMLVGNQKVRLSIMLLFILLTSCYKTVQEGKKQPIKILEGTNQKEKLLQNKADSTIILVDKFFNKISLYDKKLQGTIELDSNIWLIISGSECTECDENNSIFLYPMIIGKMDTDKGKMKFSYPGKVYYYEDESLMFETRTFYGKCFSKGNKVIVWVQKNLLDSGEWEKSIFYVELSNHDFKEFRLPYSEVKLIEIEHQIQQNLCIEIEGYEQTSEP